MDRDINILDYLPNVFGEFREFKILADTENIELTSLWETLENILDDQFILEATEYGIARREKMLNITHFADDDLESRRFRVLARANEKLPYTYRVLVNKLDQLCGEDGYALSINSGEYTVNIKIELTKKRMFEEVEKVVKKMSPANLIVNIELRYNQHSTLSKFTHSQLSKYTYRELREEVIS